MGSLLQYSCFFISCWTGYETSMQTWIFFFVNFDLVGNENRVLLTQKSKLSHELMGNEHFETSILRFSKNPWTGPYGTRISTRTEKNSRRTPGISLSRRKFKKFPSAYSARQEFIWTKEILHSVPWLLGLDFTCSYRAVWASVASTLHPSHITPHQEQFERPSLTWAT